MDAVGVPNVYVPDISFRIDERLPGSSRLNSLGQQFLGKRVDVGDADGKMGDAYLVKKNRAPVGFFSGMAGQREGRDGETLSGTQADASAGLAGVLVVMGGALLLSGRWARRRLPSNAHFGNGIVRRSK